jgi:hypothetical protein
VPAYSLTKIKLDYDEFKEWLSKKSPRQTVGYHRGTDWLPISVFLADRAGVQVAHINDGFYWIPGSGIGTTPKWAITFIRQCNAVSDGPALAMRHRIPITAKTALELLKRIRAS